MTGMLERIAGGASPSRPGRRPTRRRLGRRWLAAAAVAVLVLVAAWLVGFSAVLGRADRDGHRRTPSE